MKNEMGLSKETHPMVAQTETSVAPTGDNLAIQAALWFPPHRGRTSWLVVATICIHCLQGHRHVVEQVAVKKLTKACPVTGAIYQLDVPRAVRRAA